MAKVITGAILACAFASSASAAPPFEEPKSAPPPAAAGDAVAPKKSARKATNKTPDKAPETSAEKKDELKPPVAPACAPGSTTSVSAQVLLTELRDQKVRFADLLRAETELKQAREALDIERVEVELARAELFGNSSVPLPPPQSEDIAKVAATVKVMKPAPAASMISKLDAALATEVLRVLAKPAAAAILEKVPPDFAADLVRRLAAPSPDLAGQG